jgi:hypothetical protein
VYADALFLEKERAQVTLNSIGASFEDSTELTAKTLFRRLQSERRGVFPDHQLRALQRRVEVSGSI